MTRLGMTCWVALSLLLVGAALSEESEHHDVSLRSEGSSSGQEVITETESELEDPHDDGFHGEHEEDMGDHEGEHEGEHDGEHEGEHDGEHEGEHDDGEHEGEHEEGAHGGHGEPTHSDIDQEFHSGHSVPDAEDHDGSDDEVESYHGNDVEMDSHELAQEHSGPVECPKSPLNDQECGGPEHGQCETDTGTCHCSEKDGKDFFGDSCQCGSTVETCSPPHCYWCEAVNNCVLDQMDCKHLPDEEETHATSDLQAPEESGGSGGTLFFFVLIGGAGGVGFWMFKNKRGLFSAHGGRSPYGELSELNHDTMDDEAGYDVPVADPESWRTGQTYVNVR